jgi:hypothetical protein
MACSSLRKTLDAAPGRRFLLSPAGAAQVGSPVSHADYEMRR